jgi:hypothetical protein
VDIKMQAGRPHHKVRGEPFFVSQPRHRGPRTKTKGTGYGSAPIRDRGAPLLPVRRKTRNYKSFFEKIAELLGYGHSLDSRDGWIFSV